MDLYGISMIMMQCFFMDAKWNIGRWCKHSQKVYFHVKKLATNAVGHTLLCLGPKTNKSRKYESAIISFA